MDDDRERARLRDEADRDLYAIRRAEERLERVQEELEREQAEFERHEHETEGAIEAEWRREHWGREPERRPAWRRADEPDEPDEPDER